MKLKETITNRRLVLLLLCVPCFIFSKCRKDESLPDFYFRCNVNGQEYLPNNCANCIQCSLLGDTTLILRGNRDFETLGMLIKDIAFIKEGIYTLNNNTGRVADYKNSTLTNDRYFTDATNTGILSIFLLDKTNKIIQGAFYYKAFNGYRNDTVRVSDGKFRLRYNDH